MRSSSRSCGASRFFARTRDNDAGWSSLVARRAHNPKVAGSNPAPAIKRKPWKSRAFVLLGLGRWWSFLPRFPPRIGLGLGARRVSE